MLPLFCSVRILPAHSQHINGPKQEEVMKTVLFLILFALSSIGVGVGMALLLFRLAPVLIAVIIFILSSLLMVVLTYRASVTRIRQTQAELMSQVQTHLYRQFYSFASPPEALWEHIVSLPCGSGLKMVWFFEMFPKEARTQEAFPNLWTGFFTRLVENLPKDAADHLTACEECQEAMAWAFNERKDNDRTFERRFCHCR